MDRREGGKGERESKVRGRELEGEEGKCFWVLIFLHVPIFH